MGGFDFDVLVERKPSLRQELLTLRDHLLSADEEEEAVKVGGRTRAVCSAFFFFFLLGPHLQPTGRASCRDSEETGGVGGGSAAPVGTCPPPEGHALP